MEGVWKIYGKPDLNADPWAPDEFAAESAESKVQAAANPALPSDQYLELTPTQISVLRKPAINLAAKGQPRGEVVQDGEAPCKNVASRGFYPQHTRAAVAGKQVAKVPVDPGLV